MQAKKDKARDQLFEQRLNLLKGNPAKSPKMVGKDPLVDFMITSPISKRVYGNDKQRKVKENYQKQLQVCQEKKKIISQHLAAIDDIREDAAALLKRLLPSAEEYRGMIPNDPNKRAETSEPLKNKLNENLQASNIDNREEIQDLIEKLSIYLGFLNPTEMEQLKNNALNMSDALELAQLRHLQLLVSQKQIEGLDENDTITGIYRMQGFEDLAEDKHIVIEVQGDGSCSARSVMFGTFISASVAIKNTDINPEKAAKMQATLEIMLADAKELMKLYEDGAAIVDRQGDRNKKPFAEQCNSVIALINAILKNDISTTELVFQANVDAGIGHEHVLYSPLNAAIADLANYMLYKEAKKDGREVSLIREGANDIDKLLQSCVSYSNPERTLLCQHLQIGSQTILIRNNNAKQPDYLQVDLLNESILQKFDEDLQMLPEVAFTTVTVGGHTNLVLDSTVQTQMNKEKEKRKETEDELGFDNPEKKFAAKGVNYLKKLDEKSALAEAREKFERDMRQLDVDLNTFEENLERIAQEFSDKVRVPAWKLEKIDLLSEFEFALHEKFMRLVPKTLVEGLNQRKIQRFLNDIFTAKRFKPLQDVAENMVCHLSLGGVHQIAIDLNIPNVSPKEHQRLSIVIDGINRTLVENAWEDNAAGNKKHRYPFKSLLIYIDALKQIPCVTLDHQQKIKVAMTQYFQFMISNMPQYETNAGSFGYAAYKADLNRINNKFNEYKMFIDALGIEDSTNYVSLNKAKAPIEANEKLWDIDDNLDAFVASLTNNRANIDNWYTRLRGAQIETKDQRDFIEKYLRARVEDIKNLLIGENPKSGEAKNILDKLKSMLKALKEKDPQRVPFGVHMLQDATDMANKIYENQQALANKGKKLLSEQQFNERLKKLSVAFYKAGDFASKSQHDKFTDAFKVFQALIDKMYSDFEEKAPTINSTLKKLLNDNLKQQKRAANKDEKTLEDEIDQSQIRMQKRQFPSTDDDEDDVDETWYGFTLDVWMHEPKVFWVGVAALVVGIVMLSVLSCGVIPLTSAAFITFTSLFSLVTMGGAIAAAPGTAQKASAGIGFFARAVEKFVNKNEEYDWDDSSSDTSRLSSKN
jgi:hypothetical protein